MIKTPERNDILFGRDSESWNHEGNRRFRVLVAKHQEEYHSSETRVKKVEIVARIVNELKTAGARFLKRDSRLDAWYEVDRKACIEKVGHAIRDKQVIAQRSLLRKSQVMNNENVKVAKDSGVRTPSKQVEPQPVVSSSEKNQRKHAGLNATATSTSVANILLQRVSQGQQLDLVNSNNVAALLKHRQDVETARRLIIAEEIASLKEQQLLEEELAARLQRRRLLLEAVGAPTLDSSLVAAAALAGQSLTPPSAGVLGMGTATARRRSVTSIADQLVAARGVARQNATTAALRSMSLPPRFDLRAMGINPDMLS